jgi:hypothetical protein
MSRWRADKADDIFERLIVYVPAKTMIVLKNFSIRLYTPMSRLVAVALDKEIISDEPFKYEFTIPKDYREYMYAAECGRILDFLGKMKAGAAIDTIMLCRRDIGITEHSAVLGALAELLDKGMIESFKPLHMSFLYSVEYRRLRVVDIDKKIVKKKGFKRFDGESTKNKRTQR